VLLLLLGLILAQLVTGLVLTWDRGEAIQRATGAYSAQRIAGIVRLLEKMPRKERQETIEALDAPGMRISLQVPVTEPLPQTASTAERIFLGALKLYLGETRAVRVSPMGASQAQPFMPDKGMMMNPGMRGMMQRHMAKAGLALPKGAAYLIQVQLQDGTWVSFGERLPESLITWPLRVIIALVAVMAILLLVALLSVRWLIQPLSHLAASAKALGQDLHTPPLKEQGPIEVRSTLQAFNTMQSQIRQFVDERSRFLASVSHDLKTPITRLRLRAGLLEDEALRTKFERDLKDMENLVENTLDFMRNAHKGEALSSVDINDLLETLQIDAEDAGQQVSLSGKADTPLQCHPTAFRRVITNLVDNAVKYGQRADIEVEDSPEDLLIRISDAGPGIAEEELDNVFEPFHRLEDSRNRKTGGSGLGLSIARNIIHAHNGEITLKNKEGQGLIAEIHIPRER